MKSTGTSKDKNRHGPSLCTGGLCPPAGGQGAAPRGLRARFEIRRITPRARRCAALALRAGGLFGEAEKHARRALELAPGQPDLLFILGLCLWSAGAPEEARTLFEEAVQKAPERSDLVMDYAGFLIYQRQFQDALALAEKARALAPNHPKPIVLETCAREGNWHSEVDALAFRAPSLPEGRPRPLSGSGDADLLRIL